MIGQYRVGQDVSNCQFPATLGKLYIICISRSDRVMPLNVTGGNKIAECLPISVSVDGTVSTCLIRATSTQVVVESSIDYWTGYVYALE